MITRVGLDDIEAEVFEEKGPVLVIYLGDYLEKTEQFQIVQSIVQRFPGHLLKLYLLEEESVPKQNILNIFGAPTFILVKNQQVIDRLLGQTDEKDLLAFIIKGIPELNEPDKSNL